MASFPALRIFTCVKAIIVYHTNTVTSSIQNQYLYINGDLCRLYFVHALNAYNHKLQADTQVVHTPTSLFICACVPESVRTLGLLVLLSRIPQYLFTYFIIFVYFVVCCSTRKLGQWGYSTHIPITLASVNLPKVNASTKHGHKPPHTA